MKRADAELVRKMKERLAKEKERQKRWRDRQKEKGRKSVAGMVTAEAFAILQQEKARTGEKVSEVLERALFALAEHKPAGPPTVSDRPSSPPETPEELKPSEEMVSEEVRAEIVERIVRMRAEDGLPFNEIARRFNAEEVPPLEGKPHWEGRQIYDIYKTLESSGTVKYHKPE